jgi:hypothetical protein
MYDMMRFAGGGWQKRRVEEVRTYVILDLRDLRALLDVLCKGVAQLALLGRLGESAEELVVDFRMYEDARAGAARLAVVPAAKIDNEQPV